MPKRSFSKQKFDFGFIQGRMSRTPSKEILQYFPQENWRKEFLYASKNNFRFIEYFAERKFNEKNPFWSSHGLNEIKYLSNKFCELMQATSYSRMSINPGLKKESKFLAIL